MGKIRYGAFRKKDYVRVIKVIRDILCEKFGYKRKPNIYETKLDKNYFMVFVHGEGEYAILYDYKQFKKAFGNEDFDIQKAYVASIMAHEMRHYYQHRQMGAKIPKEEAETIARWKDNELNYKHVQDGCSVSEFYTQALELDATLYEYVFGAKIFGLLILHAIKDENHFNAMENLYIKYFGKTDGVLFNDDIRKKIKN